MNIKMIRRTTFLAAALFLITGLSSVLKAQSADITIGYVNPQAVLANMPEMKAVQQRIQNFTARKQQELTDKEQKFQTEVAAYQQKAGVISADAKAKEEERLAGLQQELVNAQQKAESEVQQRRSELLGPLYEQIGNAINEVATEMKLTYVLNTTTSTGDLIILYAAQDYQEKYDITQKVMEKLGMFN